MTEHWRPVPGHEGYYEVSNIGNVRSLTRTVSVKGVMRKKVLKGKPMKIRSGTTGYPYVLLCKNGEYTKWWIHHLVLAAFVGPRPPGYDVRHLNGDPQDSRVTNLAYGTRSQNMHDKKTHGTDHQLNKTQCPYGHPYSGDNLYVDPKGGRYCRTCKRLSRKGPYADPAKRTRTAWVPAAIATAFILPGLLLAPPADALWRDVPSVGSGLGVDLPSWGSMGGRL